MSLRLEFGSERHEVDTPRGITIGRDAGISIDDNPHLDRRVVRLSMHHGLWWITNVSARIVATVSDSSGVMRAELGPGGRTPLVFDHTHLLFSAGPTSYEFTLHGALPYSSSERLTSDAQHDAAALNLTHSQRLLLVVLCERMLRRPATGRGDFPTSAEAARRLGWSLTAFNRKLDNVCDKLDRLGVPGLRGGRGNLAVRRRLRLVEYAVAARLVTVEDLRLLP